MGSPIDCSVVKKKEEERPEKRSMEASDDVARGGNDSLVLSLQRSKKEPVGGS